MPEVDVHEVFERFRHGGPLTNPVGPDAARSASHRRRRLRVAASAVAVVVAMAAPVIAYALGPRGSAPDVASTPTQDVASTPARTVPTTPATTSSPPPAPEVEPTDVPAAATLQEADLPTGYRFESSDIDGDWTLEFAATYCAPPYDRGLFLGDVHRGAVFRTGSGPDARSVLQRVDRHSVAMAQAYVRAVRAMAQGCVPWRSDGHVTWTIAREGFAGDESLVLTWEVEGIDNTYIVVRAGGLVTQIWSKDAPAVDPVQLGQRAAARLCEGTTAC